MQPGSDEDRIRREWPHLSGLLKDKWEKLTDEDLCVAHGDRDYLTEKLRERYRVPWDEANRHVRALEEQL